MRFLEFLCGEHPQSAHAPGYARLCPRGAGVSGVSCGRRCGVDRRYPAVRVAAWIEAVTRELAAPSVKQPLVAIRQKETARHGFRLCMGELRRGATFPSVRASGE
jgi:hypothetical protein